MAPRRSAHVLPSLCSKRSQWKHFGFQYSEQPNLAADAEQHLVLPFNPDPKRNPDTTVHSPHTALTLPCPKAADVPQYNSLLQHEIQLLKLQLIWKKGKSPPEPTPHIIHWLIIRQTFTPCNSPVWLKTGTEMAINCWLLAHRQGGTRFGEKRDAKTDPLSTVVPNIKEPVTQLQGVPHSWMATLDVKYMIFVIPLQEHNKAWFTFTGEGVQRIFNRLLQGYKHSPTTAHKALAKS